jgi:hypothetical protein
VIICNGSFYFVYLSYALFTCKKQLIVCICLIGHKYSVLIKQSLATYSRNFLVYFGREKCDNFETGQSNLDNNVRFKKE